MPTTSAKPRRRWLQFSLKGLMLLVVIVAMPCGWLKWKLDCKAMERSVVAEIEDLGGQVGYDWQAAGKKEPPGAAWLRKLLGDDFFSTVVSVWYEGNEIDDETLLHMDLSGLTTVFLNSEHITDIGLRCLTTCNKVRVMALSNTGVTDAGWLHLKRLTALEQLGLGNTAVTGTDIGGNNVTDAGLLHLKEFPGLSDLTLHYTGVGDAGLVHLKGLSKLKRLSLEETHVTAAGVAELQKALPNCTIIR